MEGLRCETDHLFCVQYHPESAPGPQDSSYLIDAMAAAFRLIDHTNFDRYASYMLVQLGFTATDQIQALVYL